MDNVKNIALGVLIELAEDCWRTADEHGWHDTEMDTAIPTNIALIHSELSEALECFRNDEPFLHVNHAGKPEGIASEFADAMIRIFDICYEHDIPLAEVLLMKMEYNKTRSHRHGGKKV